MLSYIYSWVVRITNVTIDTQQDIEQTSTSFSNGTLTVSFTRPIVSSDKSHDLDLDVCRNVWWAYGGNVIDLKPIEVSLPAKLGYFDVQICLNNCQRKYIKNIHILKYNK